MPAKWQTWMPRVIDAWCGSANVQSLTDAAYRAYDYLLMAQWQSEDGMLPSDDAELAKLSRMFSRWGEVRGEVLGMFAVEGSRLFSKRLLLEWQRAQNVHDRKSTGAAIGNRERAVPLFSDSERSPETATATTTGTSTKGQEQNSCTEPSSAPQRKLVCTLPLIGKGNPLFDVYADEVEEWVTLYPAVDVKQQLRTMKGWLIGNPNNRKTRSGMGRFIHRWLAKAQNEARPTGGTNGTFKPQARTAGNVDAAQEVLARRQRRRDSGSVDETGLRTASSH